MAEMKNKKIENIDAIKLINELKDENYLPRIVNSLRDSKKRLDTITHTLDEIRRQKEALAALEIQKREEEIAKAQAPVIEEKEEIIKEVINFEIPAEPQQIETEIIEDKIINEEAIKEDTAKEGTVKEDTVKEETKKEEAVMPKETIPPKETVPSSRVKQFNHNNNTPWRPDTRNTADNRPPFDRRTAGTGRPASTGTKPFKSGDKRPIVPPVIAPATPNKSKVNYDKKEKVTEDKKAMNKRTLVRRGFVDGGFDEEGRYRKHRTKKMQKQIEEPIKIEKAIITTDNLTVKMLSEKIGITAQEILKKLMILGIMTTINSVVDFETMELVADEFGVKLEKKMDKTKEEELTEAHFDDDSPENLQERPPIVTVMGHVDHGKTSLLDAIRKTSVTTGEAGGITQHIGAYTVSINDKKITFIDTPGHEAFTSMRARGAKVTDIVILVVAADDGVMPQTIEAISHAKAANVPIIVAINKIDKPTANPQKILEQLTQYGVVCEAWGGESPAVEVSAKTGKNIDKLLTNILDLAELSEYKANPNRNAHGTIVEAKLDKNKGPVANIIVQNGTLHLGDMIVSGTTYGRIRAMQDDKGRTIKEAGPSMPVSILGISDVPNAGDIIYVVDDEKLAKQVISERVVKQKQSGQAASNVVTLNDVFNKISEGQLKELNLIIKADVQGSVEALKDSLSKLGNEEVRVNTIHCSVGAINKSDVMLAEASNGIIIGFNVRPDSESKQYSDYTGIDIRLYRIIYDAIDDVNAAIKGMLEPKFKETINGQCEVRNVFKITGSGIVAGCYVLSGKILRASSIRVLRESIVVFDGSVGSLKRLKDDVKEVASGFECGVTLNGFSDYKIGDILESYNMEKI